MTITFAGMVKPQRGLVDYTGVPIAGQYSTVWTGNYNGSGEGQGRHTGVDINLGDCQVTEIRAIAQGTIVDVVNDWQERNPNLNPCGDNFGQTVFGTWGNYVIVRHDDIPNREGYYGTAFSIYTHLFRANQNVTVGDKVLRGTVIGYQGSTGHSSAAHLHFQMDRDKGGSHPYSFGPANDPYTTQIAQFTFNPMRFVQAQIVRTTFSSAALTNYYVGTNASGGEVLSTQENEAEHEWFTDGPLSYLTNNFSVRWDGNIQLPPASGWIFYATADDGVRLWIDNNQVINQWVNQPNPATHIAVVRLTPGTHQVRLEYYESSGNATIQLAWQPAFSIYLPLIRK